MPSVSLTVVIHLSVDSEGNTEVMMDSPDQGVYGLKGDVIVIQRPVSASDSFTLFNYSMTHPCAYPVIDTRAIGYYQ